MSDKPVIEENITIQKTVIEKVYLRCLKWVKGLHEPIFNINTKILEESFPFMIKAEHIKVYSRGDPYLPNDVKILTIKLQEIKEEVNVRLIISYGPHEKFWDPRLTMGKWASC